MPERAPAWAPLLALLGGCSAALPPAAFDDTSPPVRPELFFAGHTRSAGVFETADGTPTGRFAVDAIGRSEPDGSLVLEQSVRQQGEAPFTRLWHLRALGDGRYAATGPAIQGVAEGEAHGHLFRLSYTETIPPGGWLRTVRFDHWMYLGADGDTLVNRFTIRKLGLVIARATEVFSRVP